MAQGSIQKEKKNIQLDIIIVASFLALGLILLVIVMSLRQNGAVAVIEVKGERVAEYPLDVNGEYVLGDGTNILVIENGEAYMSYADCPDGTCKNTGRIKYAGQSIICLPNRISVIIEGPETGDVDFIS